mgnify:CR=1 FL=1
MPTKFVRVRSKENGAEYSLPKGAFNPDIMDLLDEPATRGDGRPLPPTRRKPKVNLPRLAGYATKTVPALRREIEDRNAERATGHIEVAGHAKKADLVAALQADDKAATRPTVETVDGEQERTSVTGPADDTEEHQ